MEATAPVTSISASRIGPMLGVSPHQSPLGLYHELRGEIPHQEDNELLEEGREFEDAIARIACRKYGMKLRVSVPIQLSAKRHVTITGRPDRLVIDEEGKLAVLEVKNTLFGTQGEGGWGDPGSDKVPMHYWFQAHTYAWLLMAQGELSGLLGERCPQSADYAYIAARLFGGVQLYRIKLDMAVMDRVIKEAVAFLDRVNTGNPPDAKDEADMRVRWMAQEDKEAVANQEVIAWCKALKDLSAQRKLIEKQETDLKTLLLGFAQEASKVVAVDDHGIKTVVATLGSDRKFDDAKFLADHPDLLAKYSKLDLAKLAKEQRKLYDSYMRRPANVHEQKRVIRLKGE